MVRHPSLAATTSAGPRWAWWKVAGLVILWPAGLVYVLVRLRQCAWPTPAKVATTASAGLLALLVIASAEARPRAPANLSAAPSPSARASPSALPAPDTRLQGYTSTVVANAQSVAQGFDQVSAACGARNVARCKAALETFGDQVTSFQAALVARQAPACLSQPDRELKAALAKYEAGDRQAIDGINRNRPAEIVAASKQISSGTTQLDQATADVKAARC